MKVSNDTFSWRLQVGELHMHVACGISLDRQKECISNKERASVGGVGNALVGAMVLGEGGLHETN